MVFVGMVMIQQDWQRHHILQRPANHDNSPEASDSFRSLIHEQLAVLDSRPVVINEGADVDGRARGDEDEVVFIAVAVGEMGPENGAGTCLKGGVEEGGRVGEMNDWRYFLKQKKNQRQALLLVERAVLGSNHLERKEKSEQNSLQRGQLPYLQDNSL